MPANTVFYNTQHAPFGAFASFTLGARGARGGFGLELGGPANQNVYVGLEESPGEFSCLPFYDDGEDGSTRFDVESEGIRTVTRITPVAEENIRRTLTPGQDEWTAGGLSLAIHSPVLSAPDPESAAPEDLALAYAPVVVLEITVSASDSPTPRRVLFGYQSNDPLRGLRLLEQADPGLSGIACGGHLALVACSPGLTPAVGFSPETILDETRPFNRAFLIGPTGLLVGTVPPGRSRRFRVAVCFHRAGTVTTGMKTRYLYGRFFPDLESVARYAATHFSALKDRSRHFERRFARARNLNPARRFMLAQAIHSYYASTELLEAGGKPLWIVNEGEYRMMNTFDLMADQAFFETELNPWTVRNELDWYLRRYTYTDTVRQPGNRTEYPGGLAFTHDMGVANHFSAPGRSAYEKAGLAGCFSHMSHEELVNWIVCALLYVHKAGDMAWAKKRRPVFARVLDSLLHRDHPDPARRDGVMSLDSSRCDGGAEITTYDSLDVSLGQARNNLYLAVKCWGCYVGLENLFRRLGDAVRADACAAQSRLAAATICAAADKDGLLPAVLGENVASRIIPAIEGLIIPHQLGLHESLHPGGPHGRLVRALARHLRGILRPGVCLFPGGAWKISSTSNNSWLSKVYLCQFVAEKILRCVSAAALRRSDTRHAEWLLDKSNAYWAWSDQFVSGRAVGSRYYPRGVTAILWLS